MLRVASARWSLAISQAREAAARGVDLTEVVAKAPPKAPPPKAPPPPPPPPVVVSSAATGGADSFWLCAPPTTTTLLGRLSEVSNKSTVPKAAAEAPKAAPVAKEKAPKKAKAPAKAKVERTPDVPLVGNPLLVLCDMNGTLIHRSKTPLPVSAKPAVVANGMYYYARDHAEDLVQFLLDARKSEDPERRRVVFAFYTSMQESNAMPIVKYLARGQRVDVYERKFNKDDPEGENAWDTMRDLPKVWGWPGKCARGFDETNTVVIDDTHRKMREHPSNVLVVPTYDEKSVRKGGDDALEYLQAYVDALLDHADDVRVAVDDRPFQVVAF